VTPAPLWSTKLVKGEPVQVGQRQFIPVVQVRSTVRRQVTFGTDDARGSGGGFVWLKPVAVIERRLDGEEQRFAIRDVTATAITGMVTGALAMPLIYLAVLLLRLVWRHRPGRPRSRQL
jgi:hypothetical protein